MLFPKISDMLFTRSRRNRRSFQRSSFYSAHVEVLEDRILLTGNVKAVMNGNDLIVEGDSGDNEIALAVIDGNLVVQGINGTTINSVSSFVAITGSSTIPNDLRISMGRGDDVVIIGPGIEAGGDVTIDTGEGDDLINLDSLVVGDDLTIHSGQGDDTILLTSVSVSDDQRIDSGPGQDTVKVADSTIGDNLWIETSQGNDVAAVVGTTVGDTGSVSTGLGDDILGVLGVDDFRFETDSGTGQDQILFFRIQVDILDEIIAAEDRVGELINPVAVDDSYAVAAEEASLTVDAVNGVLANDTFTLEGEHVAALLDDRQLDGSVTLNADGSFVYIPNIGISGTKTFTYSITNVLGGVAEGTVDITVEGLSLELDLSANDTIQSNGTLLTKNATFQIDGVTAPDATIEIDRDGDGLFDDGTVVADATGFFSIDVTLIHDTTNFGAHTIEVRSSSAVSNKTQSVDVNVHLAIGTVVRFNSSQGTFNIELLDADAPNTVANFLNYVDSGRLENTIIHRSVFDFVIQGGGFTFDDSAIPQIAPVVTDAPIQNEFDPANSNLRGTLSMAQGPDINSGTSQWFVNVDDANQFLDNTPHTVFGRVIGTGMEIVDAINALFTFNIVEIFGEGALTDVPLDGFVPSSLRLTGTVSIDAGSDIVTGTGTAFTDTIQGPGSNIRIDGQLFTVVLIESDTQLTINVEHPTGLTDVQASIEEPPDESHYVIFSDISKILEP